MLSREADDGAIENIYRLQIMNTGDKTRTFRVSVTGIEGIRLDGDNEVTIAGGEIGTQTAVVKADTGATASGATPITFGIADVADTSVSVTERSKFWMP